MTDSLPEEPRQAEPAAPKGGFRLRFFLLIAAPAALLGLGGAYLLLSLAQDSDSPVRLADFLPAYLSAAALAIALAAVLAYAADFALRRRLRAIERMLRAGSRGAGSLVSVDREWSGLRAISRAAREAVERTDDRVQDAEELKALQRAADDLLERIRLWAETEIPPGFEASGPLAEVSAALQTLARHLEERFQEARDVTELARQSLAEACESIERAARESGRSAREVASLLTASGEVKRLGAELAMRLRESGAEEIPAPVEAAINEAATGPAPYTAFVSVLESARERSLALATRLESLERLALRAALELAAEGISERREAGSWLDRVQTLRHVSLGARAVREESQAFAEEVDRTLAALPDFPELPEPVAASPAPATRPAVPEALAAMAERMEQWGSDAYSRSERLSALAQRLSSEFAAALASARTGTEELAGLTARFEARVSAVAGEEGARERAAQGGAEGSLAWPAGSRPLRLLTREDVLPEEDEAGSRSPASPRDA